MVIKARLSWYTWFEASMIVNQAVTGVVTTVEINHKEFMMMAIKGDEYSDFKRRVVDKLSRKEFGRLGESQE